MAVLALLLVLLVNLVVPLTRWGIWSFPDGHP